MVTMARLCWKQAIEVIIQSAQVFAYKMICIVNMIAFRMRSVEKEGAMY